MQLRHVGDVLGERQLQGHCPGRDQRVGEKFHVFRLEIIISTVAHRVGYADSLRLQRVDAENLPFLHVGAFFRHGVDEVIDFRVPLLEIYDGVDAVGLGHVYDVVDACLAVVFLVVDDVVGGMGAEIAVVVEHLLHELDAHLRPCVADKHRLADELAVEPAFKTLGRVVPMIVDPQPDRERGALERGEEGHGIVGLIVDGRLEIVHQGRGSFSPSAATTLNSSTPV